MGIATELQSPLVSPRGRDKPLVKIEANPKPRRVRFGSNVEHVFDKDYTDRDKTKIWYTAEEFAAIKSEIYTMIRAVNNIDSSYFFNELNSDDTTSVENWHWRGFEHVLERRQRKECRRQYVQNLLHFCDFSIMDDDPVGLEIFAKTQNMAAIQRAIELAAFDEMEALEVYNESPSPITLAANQELLAEEAVTINWPPSGQPAPMHICRDDISTRHQVDNLNRSLLESSLQQIQNDSLLGVSVCPWRLALLLFPCMDY